MFSYEATYSMRLCCATPRTAVQSCRARAQHRIFVVPMTGAGQTSLSDEGGRILGLENAWNHALEAKDAKALDMILGRTFIAVEIDGSVTNRNEFLAGIRSPAYQPSQAVTEESNVQVYGDTGVVVGVFRVKGTEKGKPYVRRERFVDTWVKASNTWQCVASTATLITAKAAGE